jgi:hypothetical protein
MLLVPSAVVSSKTTPQVNAAIAKNPYAALNDFHDEDDSDDDYEEEDDNDNDNGSSNHQPHANNMNIRRLLLRILISRSDIQGQLAREAVSIGIGSNHTNSFSRRPLWNIGAQHISHAVIGLHQAVQIVDEEISSFLSSHQQVQPPPQQQQLQQLQQQLQQQKLQQDAKVLQVALDHYTREEGNFQKKAEMQKMKLEQRLMPQWQSRNDARRRLGEGRWKNNPHPQMDYAVKRQEDEEELRDVKKALEVLEEVQVQSRWVRDSVRDMVQEKWRGGSGKEASIGEEEEEEEEDGGRGMHRYNGIRPSAVTLNQRVSWEEYPDPTAFGWIFTGSNETSRVEFFELLQNAPSESVLVKLDWYYTTATIKTSLDHPRQGKRQLFGSQVTPDVYVQILQNPRVHTNVRYHNRRTSMGERNGGGVFERGGGRSGGGGRGRGRGRSNGGGGGFGRGRGGRGRGRGGSGRGGVGRGRGGRGRGRGGGV